jgi:hypothetical chaperone protein
MAHLSCGIDFGTSNSSVAIARQGEIALVPVEAAHVTIPSAIFYAYKESKPSFGREAINLFFDHREGRLMRSLKRVLGTSLMKQGTLLSGKVVKFEKVIIPFLKNLKEKTESFALHQVEHVVMGRPVHFVDHDPDADRRAQQELKSIAIDTGFRHVEFQFEPIAAAFAHEVNIKGEKLALVADLGGGTSDFTVIRLSNEYIQKTDRASDILANTGIRVGGNDFDKNLALQSIMPEIGYGSTYGDKHLEVPLKPYHDLAEWSKVNFLYTVKTIAQTRQLLHQSHDKNKFGRLLTILEQETGHTLLAAAEETKISLTNHATHRAHFDFIEKGFYIDIDRPQFEEAILEEVQKIEAAAKLCLAQAQIKNESIELVILTGGTTEVPLVQASFRALFPNAAIADENKLSSVGLGLAYDSARRFR